MRSSCLSPPGCDARAGMRWRHGLAPLLALLLALAACTTRRTLTIDSDPQGARVWVDGVPRGTTPTTVPFVHPGRFDVRLEKPGHESLSAVVEIPTRFEDYPVVDLVGELTVRERTERWVGRLVPRPETPSDADVAAALERARAFRERTRQETTKP